MLRATLRGSAGLRKPSAFAQPLAMPRPAGLLSAAARAPAAATTLVLQRQGVRHMANYARHVNLKNLKTYWPQLAAGTGALVVIYGVSVLVYDVTATLVNVSFEQVFYTGFGVGIFTCAAIGGTALYAYRAVTLSPNQVFRAAMAKLHRSEVVRAKLGPHLRPGHLRAYVTVPGHISLIRGVPKLVSPHTQMLFQVVGEWGEGMATVEALKHRGSLKFNVVALDILGSSASGASTGQARPATAGRPGELLLITGKEEKLNVVGTLRGFLQAERAAYVPQTKPATDEEWVREQEELPAESEEIAEAEGEDVEATPGQAGRAEAPAPAEGEKKMQ